MQKWVFLLYDVVICGGVNVVFEHALHALEMGNHVTIASRIRPTFEKARWHKGADRFHYMTLAECQNEKFDIAIVTGWSTAYDVFLIEAKKYIYFVQSIESRFYHNPNWGMATLADLTYEMPFAYLTEATWIQEYLKQEYSQNAELVLNGIDKNAFCVKGECYADRTEGKLRVLVEGTVNNNIKNVFQTIKLCKRSKADEIWLLTSSNVDSYEGADKVFSQLPIGDVAKVYRSCDVLVKLSLVEGMFGPPLEMFHCGGTAITYNIPGSEEYIVHGENALVADIGDEEKVLQYINSLKQDKKLLERLKKNALKTAADWPDWKWSSKEFYKIVNSIEDMKFGTKRMLQKRAARLYNVLVCATERLGIEPSLAKLGQAIQLIHDKHFELVIYGAGSATRGLLYFLDEYKVCVAGIAVTNIEHNPQAIFGIKVSLITDFLEKKEKILVYISSNRYHQEIKDVLHEYGFTHII